MIDVSGADRSDQHATYDSSDLQLSPVDLGSLDRRARTLNATHSLSPAALVSQLLERTNNSQRGLARALGISPQAVQIWASGQRNCSLQSLLKMLAAAGSQMVIRFPQQQR